MPKCYAIDKVTQVHFFPKLGPVILLEDFEKLYESVVQLRESLKAKEILLAYEGRDRETIERILKPFLT